MPARKPTRKPATLAEQDMGPAAVRQVCNPDPSKYYVWVPLSSQSATPHYESQGYEYVQWSADPTAPYVRGKRGAPGTVIQRQDLVLMCIDLETKHAMDARGLEVVAERKRRISSKRVPLVGLPDSVLAMARGSDPTVENETSRQFTETS
jgi:hypothetical protein